MAGESANESPEAGTPVRHPPLTGGRLVVATIVVALSTFMTVLDASIANVAIPNLSGNPIRMFTLASWLCGIAPSLPFLLGARILQGVVAGPLIPLSQAVLLSSCPPRRSSTALSLWAMTATVGPIAGPLLGGWITDSYSWSWVFYVNIPVGLLAAGVTWIIYRDRETPTRKLPIDIVGLVLLIAWVAALQIMLDKGRDLDWFSSPFITGLGIAALISFAFFLVWELTEANPIVDLKLFALRNFSGGTVAISVSYALYFGNLALPTLLQGIPTVLWFVPLVTIILSGPPPERIPAAAGLSNFVRIFCGAAGTSIAGTVWNNRTILHHVRLTEQASVDNPAFSEAIASTRSALHLSTQSAHALFDTTVNAQSAIMGLDDFFYISTFIFILIIPLIWVTRPVKGDDGQDAVAGAH